MNLEETLLEIYKKNQYLLEIYLSGVLNDIKYSQWLIPFSFAIFYHKSVFYYCRFRNVSAFLLH